MASARWRGKLEVFLARPKIVIKSNTLPPRVHQKTEGGRKGGGASPVRSNDCDVNKHGHHDYVPT